MAKKKEKSVNVSGKPKHSLDVNRDRGKSKSGDSRSAATVRRLKMYKTRPVRNSGGKILKHDLQSKELPSTRIMPDRRWFGEFICNQLIFRSKEMYQVSLICSLPISAAFCAIISYFFRPNMKTGCGEVRYLCLTCNLLVSRGF